MPKLRCRPGDLAKIIHSINPAIIGRTVLVEEWASEHERWSVTLLGAPSFGIGVVTRRPQIGNKKLFRDSSLLPLRGEELSDEELMKGVIHG
jgi:hypothetical protein